MYTSVDDLENLSFEELMTEFGNALIRLKYMLSPGARLEEYYRRFPEELDRVRVESRREGGPHAN